jgi:hypothetical protein
MATEAASSNPKDRSAARRAAGGRRRSDLDVITQPITGLVAPEMLWFRFEANSRTSQRAQPNPGAGAVITQLTLRSRDPSVDLDVVPRLGQRAFAKLPQHCGDRTQCTDPRT